MQVMQELGSWKAGIALLLAEKEKQEELQGTWGGEGPKSNQKFQEAEPVGPESEQEQWQEPHGGFWEDGTDICKLFGFS